MCENIKFEKLLNHGRNLLKSRKYHKEEYLDQLTCGQCFFFFFFFFLFTFLCQQLHSAVVENEFEPET